MKTLLSKDKENQIDLPRLCRDFIDKIQEIVSIITDIENLDIKFEGVVICKNSSEDRLFYAHVIKKIPRPYTLDEELEAMSYGDVDLYKLTNSTISKDILIEIKFDYLHTDSKILKALLLRQHKKRKREAAIKEKERIKEKKEYEKTEKDYRRKKYLEYKKEFENE